MRFFIEIVYKNKSESKHYFDLDATSAKEAVKTAERSCVVANLFRYSQVLF